ncbi:hypothetical protein WM15_02335 [Burkholderia ubonensis]|nr:hypothetical protein WM15_02335 [Burkholderia ubonensis]
MPLPAANLLNAFHRVIFRKTIYESVDVLQTDLDFWLDQYKMRRNTGGGGATARHLCVPFSIRRSPPRIKPFLIEFFNVIDATICQIDFRLI